MSTWKPRASAASDGKATPAATSRKDRFRASTYSAGMSSATAAATVTPPSQSSAVSVGDRIGKEPKAGDQGSEAEGSPRKTKPPPSPAPAAPAHAEVLFVD